MISCLKKNNEQQKKEQATKYKIVSITGYNM